MVEQGVSPHLEPALIDALIVHGQHMLSSVFGIKKGTTKIETSRKTRSRPLTLTELYFLSEPPLGRQIEWLRSRLKY